MAVESSTSISSRSRTATNSRQRTESARRTSNFQRSEGPSTTTSPAGKTADREERSGSALLSPEDSVRLSRDEEHDDSDVDAMRNLYRSIQAGRYRESSSVEVEATPHGDSTHATITSPKEDGSYPYDTVSQSVEAGEGPDDILLSYGYDTGSGEKSINQHIQAEIGETVPTPSTPEPERFRPNTALNSHSTVTLEGEDEASFGPVLNTHSNPVDHAVDWQTLDDDSAKVISILSAGDGNP